MRYHASDGMHVPVIDYRDVERSFHVKNPRSYIIKHSFGDGLLKHGDEVVIVKTGDDGKLRLQDGTITGLSLKEGLITVRLPKETVTVPLEQVVQMVRRMYGTLFM